MLFIDNKYTRWYFNIINAAKARKINTGYTERHHIVPRSLDGTDDTDNLVDLTAKEHFICHWLLFRMTVGANKSKMANAWYRMCQRNQYQIRYFSRNYSLARKAFSDNNPFKQESVVAIVRNRMITNNPMKDPEIARKVSLALTGKYIGEDNPFYGCKHNVDTLNRMSGSNHYSKKPGYKFPTEQAIEKRRATIAKNNRPRDLKLVICPHCGVAGKGGNMTRYHFDRCATLKN